MEASKGEKKMVDVGASKNQNKKVSGPSPPLSGCICPHHHTMEVTCGANCDKETAIYPNAEAWRIAGGDVWG